MNVLRQEDSLPYQSISFPATVVPLYRELTVFKSVVFKGRAGRVFLFISPTGPRCFQKDEEKTNRRQPTAFAVADRRTTKRIFEFFPKR